MNKIFKVVWSKVRNAYVVVSEIAKNTVSGVGKRNRVKRFSMGATLAAVALTSSFFASNYAEAAVTALENAKPEYYIAVGGAQKNVNPFSSGTIRTDSNGTRYIEVNVGGEKFRYNYTTVRVNNQNKYYWVREGFGVKAITDTLHPLAGSITIDLYKIPGTNATYEGVSMSGEHGMIESNVTTGISGNHLEQIKYVQYASVTNSGGTDVLESYQYFIHREKVDEPGKYEYKDVGGNWDYSKGRYPIYDNFYKFNDDEFNELTGKYQFKGQDVDYGNVYNINGNIGVFLSKEVANAFYARSSNDLPGDVEVYGGSVYGYNNEILLSGYNSITKKWSTVWAAEVTDQQATIESMTLSEFNEILHHLHEEDAKLASEAIVNTVVNSSEKTINLQNNAGNLVPGITLGITGGSGGQNRTLSVTDTNNNRIEFETGSIVVANNGAWSDTGVNYLDTLTVNGRVYQINATTSGGGSSSENDGYYLPSINTEGKIVWEWRTGDPSNKIIAYDSLKGADGTNGLSAYEIWKQQTGNANKTEQEFLDSLKGADGSSVTVSTSTTGQTSTIILTDKNGSQSVVIEHGLKGEDAPNIVVGTTETVGANEQAEVTGDLSADGRTLTLNFKIPQGNNTGGTDTKYSIEAVNGTGNVVKEYKLKDSDGNYVGEIIQDTDTDTKYEVTVAAGASDSTVVNTYTFKEENASTGVQIVDTDTTLDEVVKTPVEGGNKYTISDTSGNSVVLEDVASATKLQSVIGDVETNTSNISNLTSQVNTNKTNISNLTTSVNANTQNISDLTTKVNTNAINIGGLTTRVEANETSITNIDSRVTNNESAIEDILDGTSVYLRLGKNNKEIALSTGGHDTSSFKVTATAGTNNHDATLRFTNGADAEDYFEVNVGSTVRASADSNHVMTAITINDKTYTVSDTELAGVNTTLIRNSADDVIGHDYVISDTSNNTVSISDVASASYVDSKVGNINQQISNLSGQVAEVADKDVYVNNTDKNLKIETKTDAGDTTYTVNLDKDVTIESSLKVGANVVVDGSAGKVSANTVAVNDEIAVGTAGAVGAVKITSTDITGLDNKTWDPNATYNSGRAATEEQLKAAISAVQQGTVAGDKYVKGGVANGTNPGQIVLEMNNASDVVIDGLEDYVIDEQDVTVNDGTATLKVTDRYGTGTYDVTINDIASKQQLDVVAGKVATNTTNISNLTTTVNSHTDSIANINHTLTNQGASITEISNKVDTNTTAITNILSGSTVKLGVDDTSNKIVLNTNSHDTSSIVVTAAEGTGGHDATLTFASGENANVDFSVSVGSTVKATTADGKLTGLTINGTPFVVQDTTLASVAVSGNDYTIYDTSGKSVVLSGIASTTYVDGAVSNINQQITTLSNTKTEVVSGSSNVTVTPSTGTNGQPVYIVSATDANTTYDIEVINGTGSVIKEYKLKDSNGNYDDVVIKDTNTVTKLVAGNGNVQLSKNENGNEVIYTVTATDTTLDAVRSSTAVTEHKVGSVVSGRDYSIYDTDGNVVEITDVASASYVNATVSNISQQIEQVAGEAAKKVDVKSSDSNISVVTSEDSTGKTTHKLSLADNIIVDESITVGLNDAIVMNKEGNITANSLRTDLINVGDVAINASGITGLSNTSWSPSGTYVSGRAATEGQLQDAVDYVIGNDIKEVVVDSTAGTVALLRNSKTNGSDNDVVSGVLNFATGGGTVTEGDRYVEISTGGSEAIKLVTGSIVAVNQGASVVAGQLHQITVNGLSYTIPTWEQIGTAIAMQDYHLHHGDDVIVVNGATTEGYSVGDDGILKLTVLNAHENDALHQPEYVYIANVASKTELDQLKTNVGDVKDVTTAGIPMADGDDNTVVNHINNLYSKVQSAATEASKKTTVSTPANGNLVVVPTTDTEGNTNYDVILKNTIELKNDDKVGIKLDGGSSSIELKNNNEVNIRLDGVSGTVEAKSVKVGNVEITAEGIKAGDKKITNVGAGEISATSTDAINGSQLYDVIESINTNISNARTEVVAGENIKVTETEDNGKKTYSVSGTDTIATGNVAVANDGSVTLQHVDVNGNANGKTTVITGLSDYAIDNQSQAVNDGKVTLKVTDQYNSNNTYNVEITDVASASVVGATTKESLKESYKDTTFLKDIKKETETGTVTEAGAASLVEADIKLDKAIKDNADVSYLNDVTLQSMINSNAQYLDSKINQLGSKVNKVGAGAAALAALHPMDFDPDDKLSFAVGAGNYAGETATALGAFYRPNEKVMMNVAGTYGNGENMVNMGVSFALDRTNNVSNSRTAMAKEIVDLREQVATQGQQIAQLVALVQQLAGVQQPVVPAEQLFPDVPENHWAYEYVNTLVSKGIIEGYPDGTFGGDRTMTRYEFAAMLFRAMEQGVVLSEQIRQEFEKELGRVRVDRVKGADNDPNKIESVRVNTVIDRDDYGSKVVQVKH